MATSATKPAPSEVISAPQHDLFVRPVKNINLRMDRVLMEYPFASIRKTPLRTIQRFQMGETKITVRPSVDGMATYYDLDVIRFAISKLNQDVDEGLPLSRKIQFTAHEFLRTTNRGVGKQAYNLLYDALRRLDGTRIETNLPSAGKVRTTAFGWIEGYEFLGERDDAGQIKRLQGITITLPDWIFDAIVHDRRVLAFSPDYFTLSSPLKRRLYDIARKFCGNKKEWKIGLPNLHQRVGTTQPLKRFRLDLAELVAEQPLPDYLIEVLDGQVPGEARKRVSNLERVQVRFVRRAGAVIEVDPHEGTVSLAERMGQAPTRAASPAKALPAPPAVTLDLDLPGRPFPKGGTLKYSPWEKIARDALPLPRPDIDMVADKFRTWAASKRIDLSGRDIEKTFIGFCTSWRS